MTFVSSGTAAGRAADAPRSVATDESRVAREAGLSYVTDARPGIKRTGTPGKFRYLDAAGRMVRDPAVLARIRSLVIPPAWTDVWICADPHGHIQATGRDAAGASSTATIRAGARSRDETKYERMIAFACAAGDPRTRRR